MEKKLHLFVVTQNATVFDADVKYVNAPTPSGSLGILYGHTPMVCALTRGVLRCAYAGEEGAVIEVSGGILEVSDNVVTVLAKDARVM